MKNYDRVNWSAVITDLLEILVLTRERLALKCDVSKAAMSFWTTGKQKPQGYARLVLVNLAKDEGLDLKNIKSSE
ncbi:MAG: hypothetical protein NE328_10200 [Lentisphaeraceae bacterium]|nr:hypothetical protein [Lentisphaeraceae bacterium]